MAIRLPLLTALWVNLHGAYLTGFLILAAYWLGALLTRNLRQVKHLSLAGLLCGLASLLNPAGIKIHLHNTAFLRGDFFPNWLAEYASTDFQSPAGLGFLVWLGLLFAVLVFLRPQTTVGERVLLLTWAYFALYAGRNVPLFAFLTAPILAPTISSWIEQRWTRLSKSAETIPHHAQGWLLAIAVGAVMVAVLGKPVVMPPDKYPVDARDHIRNSPEQFGGPMFNQYLWGGYLIAFLPEHKVFVDGRADFYGEELVKEFDLVTSLRPGWHEPLKKYAVSWSLMPADHPLNLALALHPSWNMAYTDNTATIFVKEQ